VSQSETGDGGLKASTLESEDEAIELYFRPGIGHIRMDDLRDTQIRDLYVAMRKINRPGEDTDRSDLLRRLLEARASREGQRVSSRPLSESRIKRTHAVLTTALNDAFKCESPVAVQPGSRHLQVEGSEEEPADTTPAVDCRAR
jgi:hypothetical protein